MTPTVGGTLRGVVEAIHGPVTLTARMIPCHTHPEYMGVFGLPPLPEPPIIDLTPYGGDIAVCADRMRAVIGARRAVAEALIARLTAGDTPVVVEGGR